MKAILERRMADLRAVVEQAGLRGIIISQPSYIYHLTNWLPPEWVTAFLVAGPHSVVLVSSYLPGDEPPVCDETILFDAFSLERHVDVTAEAAAALQQAASQAGLIGQTAGAVLNGFAATYALPLIAARVNLRDAAAAMAELTMIKDEAAVAEICKRIAVLDRGFAAAAETISEGVSELEVYAAMYGVMVRELGAPFTLGCVLASAERALLDEPPPTSRRLVKGDSVMIDMFPMLGSYAADYARTYLVGEPDPRQREQHGVLEAALAKGEAMLRPGVIASEIDRAVRSVIEQSDFAAHAYQHHTGHSFGLTIPEAPWLIPADHTRLRAGMIIAIEPGIYHPVSGGMRLEGNFLITEDGCEALDGYPRVLTVCS